MITLIKKYMQDPVLFGTLAVSVGVFIGSIFSYLLQFALGRTLTVYDYGTLNALLSLANIVTVPTTVLGIALIKIASDFKAQNAFDKATKMFWRLTAWFVIFGAVFFATFYLFRTAFANYMNIKTPDIFLYFGIFMLGSFIMVTPSSFLQGFLRFKAFAFSNVFIGFTRLAFPVLLVVMGLKLPGVFIGFALSGLISFVVLTSFLKKNFQKSSEDINLTPYFKKVMFFSAPVLLVSLGMMLLNNIDVILVKKFFDEVSAGYYASVVTVGKVLLFGAGTVSVVMFPQMSEAFSRKVHLSAAFKKFFVIQVVLVLAGVAVFSLVPHLIISTMFGDKFLGAVPYLPKFSIFMGLYVLVNFMTIFFLALEKTKVFFFQIPAIFVQFLLLNTFNKSIDMVINVNIGVAAALLALLGLYGFITLAKERT